MKNKSFRSPLKIESEKTGEEKMATRIPNIKAQDVKGLQEFIEEVVQKELESRVEKIVKNYLEKEDIDIDKLKECVSKNNAKILM